MALKGDRRVLDTYIDYFLNEVAEKGVAVWATTAGSGSALDQGVQLATRGTGGGQFLHSGPANALSPSGAAVLGILLSEMVNIDQTRQHINFHQDQVQQGGKVTILSKGWCVTNRVLVGQNPTIGQTAYVTASGFLTPTSHHTTPVLGRFESLEDEDGFIKVSVDIEPVARTSTFVANP